jgi:hypothetical protein
MLRDRYGNDLSSASEAARDAYITGVDRLLSGNIGADTMFSRAIAEDDGFAWAMSLWPGSCN